MMLDWYIIDRESLKLLLYPWPVDICTTVGLEIKYISDLKEHFSYRAEAEAHIIICNIMWFAESWKES